MDNNWRRDSTQWLWHLQLQSRSEQRSVRRARLIVELQLLLLQQEAEKDCVLQLSRHQVKIFCSAASKISALAANWLVYESDFTFFLLCESTQTWARLYFATFFLMVVIAPTHTPTFLVYSFFLFNNKTIWERFVDYLSCFSSLTDCGIVFWNLKKP